MKRTEIAIEAASVLTRRVRHKPAPALLFLCAAAVWSCGGGESRLETFRRIDREVVQNSKAYETLEEATETIGHRLTGSENGKRAEEYVFNKFREYGFDDVRYDEFEVEAWSRGDLSVAIDGENVAAVSLGHSPLAAEVSAPVVDVGSGREDDYTGKAPLDGKIALFYIGLLDGDRGRNLHRSEKTALAIRHGAAGVIAYNEVGGGVLLTGTASVTGDLLSIPAVCIGKEAGAAIKEKLKSGEAKVTISMTNKSEPISARNVVATLTGDDLPDERIIVGGHLDSWDLATGAIDNGIGSFAILDMARAFKASNLRPRRTIEFVMFMGEEQGLLGSTHMVNEEISDGTMDEIVFMMNIDMGGNPMGVNAGGMLTDSTFFERMGAEIALIDTLYKNKFTSRCGLHSDHQPFMLEGVPVMWPISNLDESIYDCYHSDCDDFRLVNKDHIRNTARFGTMILYGLADSEELPAQRADSETTRKMMIGNGLEGPLRIAGDWRWK